MRAVLWRREELRRARQQRRRAHAHQPAGATRSSQQQRRQHLFHRHTAATPPQIDNGFFWRDERGGLQAGLLDWYNCTRAPFAQIFQGSLGGAEPALLAAHLDGLMECFAAEYARAGGPQIDAAGLARQFRLVYAHNLVGGLTFIQSDIYSEGPPRAEWAEVRSKDDKRVMGRWNVRCRVVAIIQSLGFWKAQELHALTMEWAREQNLV